MAPLHSVAKLRHAEPFIRHAVPNPGQGQLPDRLADPLVAQGEGGEMHRDAEAGAQIQMRPHGFVRVHVLRTHEPLGLVGPDG